MNEDQLARIEGRLKKLESSPKDLWDQVQIFGGLLIPLAIAYAGHRYAATQQATTLQLEEQQSSREHEVAQVNARVGQAGLLVSILDALVGTDEKKKMLATEAVLIAVPEAGPALVRLVSTSDTSRVIRDHAKDALVRRREALIQGLFAETASQRGEAYNALMAGWADQSVIIPELLAAGRANRTNANGVNNVLILLSHMNQDALRPYTSEIAAFSREMEDAGIGPRTAERAAVLRSRLPG